MKIYKFRAWDKEMNRMLDANEGSNFSVEINAQGQVLFSKRVIPMQFTGLKDKNGKEIFEDDFVESEKHIGYIRNCDGCFEIYWTKGEPGKVDYLRDIVKQLEIIGNIYENPELLK